MHAREGGRGGEEREARRAHIVANGGERLTQPPSRKDAITDCLRRKTDHCTEDLATNVWEDDCCEERIVYLLSCLFAVMVMSCVFPCMPCLRPSRWYHSPQLVATYRCPVRMFGDDTADAAPNDDCMALLVRVCCAGSDIDAWGEYRLLLLPPSPAAVIEG